MKVNNMIYKTFKHLLVCSLKLWNGYSVSTKSISSDLGSHLEEDMPYRIFVSIKYTSVHKHTIYIC